MRLWPALFALAAGGCGAGGPAVPAATRHPLRVMSMNQCTDQLVLDLLPPGRIASVSWLARDPGGSLMARAAGRVGVNHGLVEDVLAQKPDLVVTGAVSTPALRAMLTRLGYPMIVVDQARSLDDIRRMTRQVAAAVDERARGEALIARMDQGFARLAAAPGPPIRVVAWDRTGFAAGPGTLYNVILGASGAHNLAGERAILDTGKPDVEQLMAVNPALLVTGAGATGAASLSDEAMRHRVVRDHWRDRTLTIPQAYYVCGTPRIADAAFRLRSELRRAADRVGPALPIAEARP